MRYSGYRSMEKKIAASDSGGIFERWKYGHALLADPDKTTENGNLRHGVLAKLIGAAAKADVKLSEREVRYRIQCARAYQTEAEIGTAGADFEDWTSLREAGFPPVEAPEGAEPYDPRTDAQKLRDARAEIERRKAANPHQAGLWDWDPPQKFGGDEHGPRSTIKDLESACDRSEDWTARMAVIDAERRSYVEDLKTAAGGDVDMTWYEAEQRRVGLEALGLTDWSEIDEIKHAFFDFYDAPAAPEPDDSDDEDD